MCKFLFFLLSLLILSCHIEAEEEHFRLDGQAEPSSYIYGCVNAITGTLLQSSQDLVVDCPEPISFTRHYNSHNYDEKYYGIGFTHNHPTKAETGGTQSPYEDFELEDSGGDLMWFIAKKDSKAKENWFYLNAYQMSYGVTNCGGDEISGRTNIKNIKICQRKKIKGDRKKENFTVTLGDGTQRFFEEESPMSHEIRPSGNIIYYTHDKSKRIKPINQIRATDSSGNITLGWMNFTYLNYNIHVETSDGKSADYTLSRHEKNQFSYYYSLDSCSMTGVPLTTYYYKEKHKKVSRNITNNIRLIERIDRQDAGSIKFAYSHKKVDKISLLNADNKFVPVFYIYYEDSKRKTTVWDIGGGETVYKYSRHKRLNRKDRYKRLNSKDTTLYSSQLFFWGKRSEKNKAGKPIKGDVGNLITKAIANGHKKPLSLITYTYDPFGNVLKETIAGHLTGLTDPRPFESIKDGRPDLSGRETYSRHYTYTADGFNLVLTEVDDDGEGVMWEYLKGTDLPKSKLRFTPEGIYSREFLEYGNFNILVKKITDDGSSTDPLDLADVSHRVTTVFENNETPLTPGFGKPKKVIEYYLDPQTGMRQLKRIDYEYGKYNLVVREDHYDSENNLKFTLSYQYDDEGNRVEEVDPIGRVTRYRYNKGNKCVYKELLGSGFSISLRYDTRGRLAAKEELHDSGEVFVQSFEYDNLDRKIAEIDSFGNRTSYHYDSMGRLIRVVCPRIFGEHGNPLETVEHKSYNIWDQVTEEKDSQGFSTHKSYNCRGQITRVEYSDGSSESFLYNLNGTPNKQIYRNGSFSLFFYDCQKRKVCEERYSEDGKLLFSRKYAYERGNLVSETDPMGYQIFYSYDGAGRLISKEKIGLKNTFKEECRYDTLGRLSETINRYASGENEYKKRIVEYDNIDRMIKEMIEDGSGNLCNLTSYTYDINSNCTETAVYQNQNLASRQRVQYTSFNLPIKKIDALGFETNIFYDFSYINEHGQNVLKTIVVDPNGIQTVSIKNSHNKDVSIEKFDAISTLLSSEKIFYDNRDSVIKKTALSIEDALPIREYQVAYAYDSMKRPIAIIEDPLGKNKKVTMTYTKSGAIESKIKPDGVTLFYQYDGLGREITVSSSDQSVSYEYSYDLNDNLTQSRNLHNDQSLYRSFDEFSNLVSEKLPSGNQLFFQYDDLKRVTRILLPDNSFVAYKYGPCDVWAVTKYNASGVLQYRHDYEVSDWQHRSVRSKLITGEYANFEWDLLGRMTLMKTPYFSENIPEDAYDPMGNLIYVQFETPHAAKTDCFEYDDLNQLLFEDCIQTHSYQNDSLHNRTKKDQDSYSINSINQIESDDESSYLYDPNGNLIMQEKPGFKINYSYDAFDRLIKMTKENEWKIENEYDSFGRLVSRVKFLWNNGWVEDEVDQYIYQGILEIGSTNPQGDVKTLRVMGKTEGLLRAAIAVEINGNIYAPIYDHRANLIGLIAKDGKKPVESYRYSAFGEAVIYDSRGNIAKTSSIGNPWLFASCRLEELSGLYNFGKRFYQPSIGKWITQDQAGFIDGLNLYAYTHNNPMACTDLLGFATSETKQHPPPMPVYGGLAHGFSDEMMRPIGRTIQSAAHHFIPSSYLQYYGEGIGRVIYGKSFHHKKSWEIGSVSGVVGEKPFPNAVVRYIPGIMTSKHRAEEVAKSMSDNLDGHQVHYTCRQSRGFASDGLAALSGLLGMPSKEVDDLRREIVNDYALQRSVSGDKTSLYYLPHSRGGLDLYNSTRFMSERVRDSMEIRSYGSLEMLPSGMYKSADNCVNSDDVVPKLGKLMNYFRKNQETSIIGTGYSSKGPTRFFSDHDIESKGYADDFKGFADKIIEKENEK
ncbi:MAG: putative deoxyribonuclease RhsC [Chlamydiae bacterium]|nr:putative deoxyribonuclease RhsC [Chlamydiota bacterium]